MRRHLRLGRHLVFVARCEHVFTAVSLRSSLVRRSGGGFCLSRWALIIPSVLVAPLHPAPVRCIILLARALAPGIKFLMSAQELTGGLPSRARTCLKTPQKAIVEPVFWTILSAAASLSLQAHPH